MLSLVSGRGVVSLLSLLLGQWGRRPDPKRFLSRAGAWTAVPHLHPTPIWSSPLGTQPVKMPESPPALGHRLEDLQ